MRVRGRHLRRSRSRTAAHWRPRTWVRLPARSAPPLWSGLRHRLRLRVFASELVSAVRVRAGGHGLGLLRGGGGAEQVRRSLTAASAFVSDFRRRDANRLAVGFRRRLVVTRLAGQAIDELALVDGRNLHGNVVAERTRLLLEQHRQDDRGGERQYDRADQASARLALHFVDQSSGLSAIRSAMTRCALPRFSRTAASPRPAPPRQSGTIRKRQFYQLRRTLRVPRRTPRRFRRTCESRRRRCCTLQLGAQRLRGSRRADPARSRRTSGRFAP